jgi:tellurium resistance protein TerZ
MVRGGDGWRFQLVQGVAQDGRHFMDILEPTIGDFVRSQIPGAPQRLKAAFAMEKGSVVDLPQSSAMPRVVAGLGWDVNSGGSSIDLDVSAVLYDVNSPQQVDCVFFGNLEACGLTHSGDNLTGEGDGDDEQLSVNFEKVPAKVTQIIFVVNIYTRGVTFQSVRNPYCRIFNEAGEELARYQLTEAGNQSGLIVARMFRASGGDRWGFQAVGSPCRGNTWKDSVQDLRALRQTDPRALQGSCVQGGAAPSTGSEPFSNSSPGPAPVGSEPAPQLGTKPQSQCCSVM